jgi:SAM-dependent methyltransferase
LSAADNWRAMVEAEEAQTNELRSDDRSDYWQGLSSLFKQDPRRTDDPDVSVLSRFIDADSTVLDVGAGAGRIALPLALKTRRVVAIEPSAAMCKDLAELKAEYNIDNVDVVESTWEEASVEPADVAFSAHVVYTVKDIGAFLEKLTTSARRTAAVIVWVRAPLYFLGPLWRDVYGIERLNLPAFPELLEVLWEMGIEPQVELGPARPQRGWPDKESALQMLRHRLFIGDSRDDLLERLRGSLDRRLVQTEDGWTIGEAPLRGPILVHWPGSA